MAGQNFRLHEIPFGTVGKHPAKKNTLCSQGGYGGRQLTLLAPTNNAIKKAAEANRESHCKNCPHRDVKACKTSSNLKIVSIALVRLHPGNPNIEISQLAILLPNIVW